MTRKTFIAAAFALATVLPAIPAQAASLTRTFVSSAGMDTNPCTITQPCATFARAYSLTAASGIIAALDPGKYGPVTIMGPITINGNGWAAITGPANGNAITINAGSTDKILLIGLEIDGANAPNTVGIELNSGGSLTVRDSTIQNFTRYGILYQPTNLSKILIMNTQVSDNNYGIYIGPVGPANTLSPISGVLDHVHTDNNTNDGITVITAAWLVQVTISDSVCANNGGIGVVVTTPDPSNTVIVRNSAILNNGGVGLVVNGGGGGTIAVTRSTAAGNSGGSWSNGGGFLLTYNDNIIFEGGSNPTQVLPYK
jgi:hypothetical protein